jgi:hypothetical protein
VLGLTPLQRVRSWILPATRCFWKVVFRDSFFVCVTGCGREDTRRSRMAPHQRGCCFTVSFVLSVGTCTITKQKRRKCQTTPPPSPQLSFFFFCLFSFASCRVFFTAGDGGSHRRTHTHTTTPFFLFFNLPLSHSKSVPHSPFLIPLPPFRPPSPLDKYIDRYSTQYD